MHRARVTRADNAKTKNNCGRNARAPKSRHVRHVGRAQKCVFATGFALYVYFYLSGRRFTLFTSPLQPLKLHVARHGKRRFIFYRRTHRPGDSFLSAGRCRVLHSPTTNTAFPSRLNYSFFFLFDKNSATLETDNIFRACWLKRANIVFSAEIYCCYNVKYRRKNSCTRSNAMHSNI